MLSLRGKGSPSHWAQTKTQNSRDGARGCGALTYTVKLPIMSLRGFSGVHEVPENLHKTNLCIYIFRGKGARDLNRLSKDSVTQQSKIINSSKKSPYSSHVGQESSPGHMTRQGHRNKATATQVVSAGFISHNCEAEAGDWSEFGNPRSHYQKMQTYTSSYLS